MAEAETVLTSSPEPTPDLPKSDDVTPKAVSNTLPAELSQAVHWTVPTFIAVFGATVGLLTGTGLYGEIYEHFWEFAFIVVVVGSATFLFFDPLAELVQEWCGLPHRGPAPQGRKLAATVAAVAVTLLIAALDHSLADELHDILKVLEGTTGWRTVAGIASCISIAAGVITFNWIRGARQQPSRAAVYGAKFGALTGAGVGAVLVLIFYLEDKIPQPPAGSPSAGHFAHYAGFLVGAIGVPAILWLLPGLLGGLAIDNRWHRGSPTQGVLYALAGMSALGLILGKGLSYALPTGMLDPRIIWLLMGQALGWGVGAFLQRSHFDPSLDPAWRPTANIVEARNSGAVVVPIRPPQTRIAGERADASHGERPSETVGPSPSPTVLLLRPTGSRAWAAVVLVLALASGLWAWHAGIFLTDPEIVGAIQARFQQDSGLQKKALSVRSVEHIVTLAGAVDDAIQKTAAVQEASSARGVRQLIDQTQIVPPVAPRPTVKTNTNTVYVPVLPPVPPPAINVNISRFKTAGPGPVRAGGKQKLPVPPQAVDTQKHKGFFHFLKRDKKDKNKNSPAQ